MAHTTAAPLFLSGVNNAGLVEAQRLGAECLTLAGLSGVNNAGLVEALRLRRHRTPRHDLSGVNNAGLVEATVRYHPSKAYTLRLSGVNNAGLVEARRHTRDVSSA